MSTCLMAGLCLSLLASDSFGQRDRFPKVRILVRSSLLGGRRWEDAKPAMEELLKRVENSLQARLEFLTDGKAEPQEATKVGKRLSNGELEVAVVRGTECAWILREFKGVEILIVCLPGGDLQMGSLMLVRKGAGITKLSQLSGKRFARYRAMNADDLLYLHTIQQDKHVRFGDEKTEATPLNAMRSVVKGTSDCTIVGRYFFHESQLDEPGITSRLETVHFSPPHPYVALVGNRRHLDAIGNDLWTRFQTELVNLHDTPEGQEVMEFWGFEVFKKPGKKHRQLVEAAMNNPHLTTIFRKK